MCVLENGESNKEMEVLEDISVSESQTRTVCSDQYFMIIVS